MTKVRIVIALALSALAGVGIAAVAAPPDQTGSGAAAEALTAAPAASVGGEPSNAVRARARAEKAGVPLPAGGTFNGIRWETGGDAITPADIQSVLQYNAACQWLRAWRDGRNGALALQVLQTVPQWPSVRGTESGEFLATVAAEAAAGGGTTATSMLRDCDASHQREVAYANQLGLTASR